MSKKREKITYVDDGRTLADMSAVSGARLPRRSTGSTRPTFKEVWTTYWGAVKMMFLPMMAFIGGIVLLYIILYLLFSVM